MVGLDSQCHGLTLPILEMNPSIWEIIFRGLERGPFEVHFALPFFPEILAIADCPVLKVPFLFLGRDRVLRVSISRQMVLQLRELRLCLKCYPQIRFLKP